MFEIAGPSLWLDVLRVPAKVIPERGITGEMRAVWSPSGRSLAWRAAPAAGPLERYLLESTPFYATAVASHPPAWGRGWEPWLPVRQSGRDVAHVWRDADGSIFLPFDPDAAILALLSEAYVTAGRGAAAERAKGLARKAYYRARPLMPRAAQLALRRAFSRVQRRQEFPRWPVESALHDLYAMLLTLCTEVAGEPVPWLAPWPSPFTWALVLSHDVETQVGYSHIEPICELEEALGYRSSWNLVPRRDYTVEDALVKRLWGGGWEVGMHGLHHDGRDLESAAVLQSRLPEMREWAERWRATGFRAPATQRSWPLMRTLGFDYDSSYPDTDPFEPQGGGCCSWWPFFNGALVELPITLPQDHTLFTILEEHGPSIWLEKARFLQLRGGMALIDTHPDYLLEEPAGSAYRELLATFAEDETAWRPLPVELARWWRRRAETSIERTAGGWQAVGPAAGEVAVVLADSQAA